MFDCKACGKVRVYWNSTCTQCGYYQHSCMSPVLYNYLQASSPDNAEKLYSRIFDNVD